MATFSVRFLGCKVSQTDAQQVRERLLADGHTETGDDADVAVVNTCCVTHEAVSKSRQAVSRAARAHGRVYVTGCGANLADAFARAAPNVRVVARRSEDTAAFVAGDVGAIACVQGRRPARPRPCLRQGAGRLQLLVPLLRRPARARTVAQPSRRRPCSARSAGASSKATARSCSPGSTSAATAIARPATDSAASSARPGATPGLERLRLSSIEVNHVDDELVARAARDADASPRTCTCRSSPATTASSARWADATRRRRICGGSRR